MKLLGHISYYIFFTLERWTRRIPDDECKWFRAQTVITDKTEIEYDWSRCYCCILGAATLLLLRCFVTKRKFLGVYRIYASIHSYISVCILQYKPLTADARREYRRSCKATVRSILPTRPREYWETNCFFIRSNILIDSIHLRMNYSFREKYPPFRPMYFSSILSRHVATEISFERLTIDHLSIGLFLFPKWIVHINSS